MTEMPDDVYERARAAYQRHCERHGWTYQQPEHGGEIDGDIIHLTNVHGILASYRWTGKRLEMLP